jgi:uncharacterized protein YlxW (UPF0749 family)
MNIWNSLAEFFRQRGYIHTMVNITSSLIIAIVSLQQQQQHDSYTRFRPTAPARKLEHPVTQTRSARRQNADAILRTYEPFLWRHT